MARNTERPTLNELNIRMIRLEAAMRETMEQRAKLVRESSSPQYMTPEEFERRTRMTRTF
jgi:hypothetical protein